MAAESLQMDGLIWFDPSRSPKADQNKHFFGVGVLVVVIVVFVVGDWII